MRSELNWVSKDGQGELPGFRGIRHAEPMREAAKAAYEGIFWRELLDECWTDEDALEIQQGRMVWVVS